MHGLTLRSDFKIRESKQRSARDEWKFRDSTRDRNRHRGKTNSCNDVVENR